MERPKTRRALVCLHSSDRGLPDIRGALISRPEPGRTAADREAGVQARKRHTPWRVNASLSLRPGELLLTGLAATWLR
jgi:hypothetical protein